MKVLLEVTLEEAQDIAAFMSWKAQHDIDVPQEPSEAQIQRDAEIAEERALALERRTVEGRREQLLDLEESYDRINRWRY